MNDFDPIKISSFFSKTSDKYWSSLVYTHVENYIEKPKKGRLFGMIELKCDNFFDSSKNGDTLKRFLQNDYYSNNGETILESFEITLNNLKLELTKLVEKNKSSLDGKIDINCLLVSLKDNVAYFGLIGEIELELYRNGNYSNLDKFFKDSFANGVKVFSVVLAPSDLILLTNQTSKKKILDIKFDSCVKNMNFESLVQTPLAKDNGIGVLAIQFGHKREVQSSNLSNSTIQIQKQKILEKNENIWENFGSKSNFDLFENKTSKVENNDFEKQSKSINYNFEEKLNSIEQSNFKNELNIFGDEEPVSLKKDNSTFEINNSFPSNQATKYSQVQKISSNNEISPELAKEVFDINYKRTQNKFIPKLQNKQTKFETPSFVNKIEPKSSRFENDLSSIQNPIISNKPQFDFKKISEKFKTSSENIKTKFTNFKSSQKMQDFKTKLSNLNKQTKNNIKQNLSNDEVYERINITTEKNAKKMPNLNFLTNLKDKFGGGKFNIAKVLAIIFLLIIFGIIASTIVKNNNETKAQNDLYTNLTNSLKQAQDLEKNADNQVLIDKVKSQDLLVQSTQKLATITLQNTLKDANLRNQIATKVTEIKTLISQVYDKIQVNTYINDSSVLQELSSNFQGIQIVGMEISNGSIFVADARGNLYKSSLTNIGFTQILQTQMSRISSISQDLSGKILLFSATDGLFRLNDDNSLKKFDNLTNSAVGDVKSMTSFKVGDLEYLYFLVPQTRELKRAKKSGDNYSNVEVRKQDDTFATATDIKIDGKVWVLLTSGLKRYYNNATDELNMPTNIPQNLLNFQVLELDDNNVYLSDNTNKRVVILAKQSGTDTKTMQYLYNIRYNGKYTNFENILDLKVADEFIYILDSKRLYRVKYQIPNY